MGVFYSTVAAFWPLLYAKYYWQVMLTTLSDRVLPGRCQGGGACVEAEQRDDDNTERKAGYIIMKETSQKCSPVTAAPSPPSSFLSEFPACALWHTHTFHLSLAFFLCASSPNFSSYILFHVSSLLGALLPSLPTSLLYFLTFLFFPDTFLLLQFLLLSSFLFILVSYLISSLISPALKKQPASPQDDVA